MGSELRKVGFLENYDIYKFTPSLFHLFGKFYPEKIKLRRIIRFLLSLKDGYEIYYLTENDKTVAYCSIQSGKSGRFDFSEDGDIIVGPVLVDENYRRQGIAHKLVSRVLSEEAGFKSAYCYIKKENIASIKTFEKCDFEHYSDASLTGLLCNVKTTDDVGSRHIIMKNKGN